MCEPIYDDAEWNEPIDRVLTEDEREAWEYETFLKEHPDFRIIEDVGF